MEIDARALANCSVVNGGDQISLGLMDENDQHVEIKVSTSDACAILMTLPQLLRRSLEEKHRDGSLRYVFPLDTWQVEAASDGSHLILTLATGGGFEVSFSTRSDRCSALASALNESIEGRKSVRMPMAI